MKGDKELYTVLRKSTEWTKKADFCQTDTQEDIVTSRASRPPDGASVDLLLWKLKFGSNSPKLHTFIVFMLSLDKDIKVSDSHIY